jgi:hypothetical protein
MCVSWHRLSYDMCIHYRHGCIPRRFSKKIYLLAEEEDHQKQSKKIFLHACEIHAGTAHLHCTSWAFAYNCTRDLCFNPSTYPPLKQTSLESRVSTPLGFLCSTNPDHLSLHNPRTPPCTKLPRHIAGLKRQFCWKLHLSSRRVLRNPSPSGYTQKSLRELWWGSKFQHDKKGKGRGS